MYFLVNALQQAMTGIWKVILRTNYLLWLAEDILK